MLRVGLIGYGYWGPNLARNLWRSGHAKLAMIADLDVARRELASNHYPDAEIVEDYQVGLASLGLDAIVVATPLSTHEEIGLASLDAGCHVLIEKPLASSCEGAQRLIQSAAAKNKVLMVDHTFVYSQPVIRIRELVESGDVGEIQYFDSVRVNLGIFRPDSNVLWDLATHDISIMQHILHAKPVAISATGASNIPGQHENVSFMTVFFEGGQTIGHVHVNWLAPVKMRQTVVCGTNKMVVWDDLQPMEPIKVYDKGVSVRGGADQSEVRVSYRVGDATIPHLKLIEPLENCVNHFLECIRTSKTPITDGQFGLGVVRIIEAAQRSLERRGTPYEIGH